MRALLVTVGLFAALGCASAGGAVASAAVNTAIAATVSGVRRANGECYTPCTPGTKCNEKTGMCDPLPCRGECRPEETCEQTYLGEKCVLHTDLEIRGTPTSTARPTGTTWPEPPATEGGPPDAGAPAPAPRPSDAPARLPDAPTLEPR